MFLFLWGLVSSCDEIVQIWETKAYKDDISRFLNYLVMNDPREACSLPDFAASGVYCLLPQHPISWSEARCAQLQFVIRVVIIGVGGGIQVGLIGHVVQQGTFQGIWSGIKWAANFGIFWKEWGQHAVTRPDPKDWAKRANCAWNIPGCLDMLSYPDTYLMSYVHTYAQEPLWVCVKLSRCLTCTWNLL